MNMVLAKKSLIRGNDGNDFTVGTKVIDKSFGTPRLFSPCATARSWLRSVSKQFANVPQQSCTRDRKFCKTFANVSILNAARLLPKSAEVFRVLISVLCGSVLHSGC